jgi:hypothetical protein
LEEEKKEDRRGNEKNEETMGEYLFEILDLVQEQEEEKMTISKLCNAAIVDCINKDHTSKGARYAISHILPFFSESTASKQIYGNNDFSLFYKDKAL